MGEVTMNGDMVWGLVVLGDVVFACCIMGSSRIDIASGDRVGRRVWNGRAVFLYHSLCSFVFRGRLVSWSSQLVIISLVGLVALVFGVLIGLASLFTWYGRDFQGG